MKTIEQRCPELFAPHVIKAANRVQDIVNGGRIDYLQAVKIVSVLTGLDYDLVYGAYYCHWC